MDSKKIRVHSLPCTIHSNSTTNVEEYFNSCIREDGAILYTSFRGRPLTGVRFEPPVGYTAVLLTKQESVSTVAGSTTSATSFAVSSLLDNLVCWMLDPPASPAQVLEGQPNITRPVVARAAACAKLLDEINDLDEAPNASQQPASN